MATVRFLAPDTDAFVDSVLRHRDEFTEQTGLDLECRIIPSDEYFSNAIHPYLAGEDAADVYMSGPVLLWEHIGAGFAQPLEGFVERSSADFAFDDFFEPLIAANRWTGRFGDRLGAGHLWEIPVNCESYNLAYVPATLEKFGIDVPTTWREYFAAGAEIVGQSGGSIRGCAQRGTQVWHTMYTGYASQFWAYGARDFDDEGRSAIASAEGIQATSEFIAAMRSAGPVDLREQRWYELAMAFCDGRYGFIVDSDHYVAFYEDPAMSKVHGRVGYAPPLAGPSGVSTSNLWTWSLVMNARSRGQADAWRFIEWAAGPRFLKRSAFEGNMNPTRASTWDDDRFRESAAGWGMFYDVARQLAEKDARVLVTPAANYLTLADRWVRALRSAYSGDQDVAEALQLAAADIDEIVA